MKEKENRARLCIFYIWYIWLHWMQGNIYRGVFPTFLAKKSCGWWLTRRRMEIYKNIWRKISKRVGAQISGAFRNHFARENGVCEISQTQEGCEIFSHQQAGFAPLRSWLSSWGSQLPACGIYRVTSKGNPQHCTKRLRNSRNKRLIPQHFAKCFLQLRVIDLQCL